MSNVGVIEGGVGLMDDTVEMVRSNKGGAKVIHRGYMYTIHKRRIGGIRWRCARRILHCKGSITTSNTGPPVINLPHNHVPDLHAVALARSRSYPEGESPIPTSEMLLSLHLGPTARYISGQPFPLDQELISADNIKEEYYDGKELSNVSSPAPSTSSIKSPYTSKPQTRTKPAPVRSVKSASSASSVVEEAEVCLRWNSHHSNMQTTFPSLMDKEKYVDVTLAADGQIIKCHKLILSSCSTYFDDMLKSMEPSQYPIIFLPKMEFWIVKALVEFMYKGEVNVDQSKLQMLIQAAEELQVKGLAKQSSVKNETEEPPPSENENDNDDTIEDYLKPESPGYVPDQAEEEEFKPYYYYKKNKKAKPKKRKIPEPGQIKTVPCNLRGTKSRPIIKQPVFFDPDFPDHDPYRAESPPTFEKEPIIEIDDIKMEPVDFDEPSTPPNYNDDQEETDKLPLIVEIKSGSDVDFQEPPAKKQSLSLKNMDKQSPIIIEKVETSKDEQSGVELTLEKLPTNDETQVKNDIQKKFCIRVVKNKEVNGHEQEIKTDVKKTGPPPLITVKKFALSSEVKSDLKSPPQLLRVDSSKESLPSTSKTKDEGLKKIKLSTTESVLKKLSHNNKPGETFDENEENCDSSGITEEFD